MNEGKIFVDTNILVYGHDADASQKHAVARSVLEDLWNHRTGVLSVQGFAGILCDHDSKGIASVTVEPGSNYNPGLFELADSSQ